MPGAKPIDPRKRPQQERSRALVEAMVTATERVLERDGRRDTTTSRIAEVAGVSIGSLYQYFPNCDSLIETVRARQNARFGLALKERADLLVRLPLRGAVRGLVDLLIQLHTEQLGLHNALADEEPGLSAEVMEEWLPAVVAYLEARRSEIRPANLELAARIVLETLEALVHNMALRSPEKLLEDAEYAEELTQLLLRYLER